ncbi:MAG TPA: anti-sigma factor [Roseiflexaceae bacterium]|nr:anti-sigma factor [Roseiflexaceae bacterium]
MTSESNDPCIDIQPQLAAYALGEVEAQPQLLDHLAECPACQRDLRAYMQVADVLPYTAPEAEPPLALRDRIIAAIAEAHAPQPAPAHTPRPRWRWSSFSPTFAVALAMIIALLGWNISLQRQLSAQSAQIRASREGWQTMTALLNDPDVHWYALAGAGGSGHFWATPGGKVGCLVVQGLPPLGAGQVYQVWLTHGGERVSGGTFEGRNGSGWVLIRADEALADYDTLGVTIEPDGGSAMPSGPSVLRGTISATRT